MDAAAWSATRARTFTECRRKYYYRYHLAPLGRRPDAPPEACQAQTVKDLIGVEAWAGDLVHRLIGMALNRWRCGRLFPEGEAIQTAKDEIRRQFLNSQLFWDSHPDAFRSRPALIDIHYYKEGPLGQDRAAKLQETVIQSVRAFLTSDLAARIRTVGRSNWRPIDSNAAAHLEDGLLILVKPDFAFVEGERLFILDWKTGRPDPFWERIQVTCYALYAQEKWAYPLPLIIPQVVHLYPEYRVSDAEYSPETIREALLFIRTSQEQLGSLLEADAPPSPDRFPVTDNCDRCKWCAFRGLCDGAKRLAAG